MKYWILGCVIVGVLTFMGLRAIDIVKMSDAYRIEQMLLSGYNYDRMTMCLAEPLDSELRSFRVTSCFNDWYAVDSRIYWQHAEPVTLAPGVFVFPMAYPSKHISHVDSSLYLFAGFPHYRANTHEMNPIYLAYISALHQIDSARLKEQLPDADVKFLINPDEGMPPQGGF